MEIRYSFLSEDQLPEIHQAFLEAFSDYLVDVSYMTYDVISKRVVKNAIDYQVSVAAYDQSKMVGFTLVGVDDFKGHKCGFDIMTGILKDYRGRGIAGQMFDYMLNGLRERRIEKFYLEVIRDNDRAIKAYEKSGFRITRKLDCYQAEIDKLNLKSLNDSDLMIRSASREILKEYRDFLDWEPSWENRVNGIERIPDELTILEASIKSNPAGIIIYYPTLNWIMGLAVNKEYRRKGIATKLIKHLIDEGFLKNNELKVMNVEVNDHAMSGFLKKAGFMEYAGQYEMEFLLKENN